MKRTRLKFTIFHLENLEVWEQFESYALALISKGVTRHSSRGILYVIRFHSLVDKDGTAKIFSINDHYSPDYARMFAEKHPEHNKFFETRNLKSKK